MLYVHCIPSTNKNATIAYFLFLNAFIIANENSALGKRK